MEPYGFIYITTNMINGKKYIGQKKYMKHWENYLGSGVILRNAINKYGRDNFKREIIEDCITKEDLDRKEKYWISFYDATNNKNFYNIALGGDGGNTTYGYTQNQKEIMKINRSKSAKNKINLGNNNGNYKKVICLNTMEIFNGCGDASRKYNIPYDEIQECCDENSNTRTAGIYKLTGERMIWKYYDRNKEYTYYPYVNDKTNISTKVILLNTMEIFDSIKDASKKYNISEVKISHNCNHFCKIGGYDNLTHVPLYWISYDEYANHGVDEIYYQRDKIQQFDSSGKLVNNFISIQDAVIKTEFTRGRIKRNLDGITDYIDGYKFIENYQ